MPSKNQKIDVFQFRSGRKANSDNSTINGRRAVTLNYGDKEYIKARDALIPEAERFADAKISGFRGDEEFRRDSWTRHFHQRMNELVQTRIFGRGR